MPADYKAVLTALPRAHPFGFGGWVALTKGQGMDVMMGDLVLTEDEVNPVMSALLQNGLDVRALHNHAQRVKPAIDLIDQAAKKAVASAAAQSSPTLDGAALAKIIGTPGEQTGPVYKITISRPDIDLREHGAPINRHASNRACSAFVIASPL
jgi:Domain of Unknown Function (DUF1259)